jgi:hypothetical protein
MTVIVVKALSRGHIMNIRFPQRSRGWALLLMGLLLSACASSPKVHVDQDSHVSFANYRTFAWLEAKPVEANGEAPALTLVDQRVRAALLTAVQSKGYVFDQAHADVRVSYTLNVYERPKQSGMSLGLGAGGGSGNVGGGVGVSLPLGKRNEMVAALTVNVIDSTRNEQVWVGASEVVLKGKEATDADIQTLTDRIMAKYPASGK